MIEIGDNVVAGGEGGLNGGGGEYCFTFFIFIFLVKLFGSSYCFILYRIRKNGYFFQ